MEAPRLQHPTNREVAHTVVMNSVSGCPLVVVTASGDGLVEFSMPDLYPDAPRHIQCRALSSIRVGGVVVFPLPRRLDVVHDRAKNLGSDTLQPSYALQD